MNTYKIMAYGFAATTLIALILTFVSINDQVKICKGYCEELGTDEYIFYPGNCKCYTPKPFYLNLNNSKNNIENISDLNVN